jgi:hypothetical protein
MKTERRKSVMLLFQYKAQAQKACALYDEFKISQ